jgi:hypothetical protein
MLKRPKLKHKRADGESATEFSSYCPVCGFHVIEKEVLPGLDFDETGWFHIVRYSCTDTKCNHKWAEKVYALEGGSSHFYGKGLK